VTTKNFKKPPVLCNDRCGNFNCTYTFYTNENCKEEVITEPDYKTVTLYPKGCHNATCQYRSGGKKNGPEDYDFDFEEKIKTGEFRATTNLIVRGWGSYFELDRTYKSVEFNGYGNCAFFLYEKMFFQGQLGHFRGYLNEKAGHPWNAKSKTNTLCRNINLTYFNGKTGSLETNDTCWENSYRKNQTSGPRDGA